ncbi:MAG: pyridoxamine 5'-phosphate oxidase family protein [Leptolyngbyaceae cyanobacterium MO_188.B28]|nr:pyridoxamine 5'-phosphate oxidase family protein [Leptolyngbyaceae cyanobacterium MO_188.B28]
MPLALWRSPLSRALHRNRALPNSRYVQLATVRPDGAPANRTIVFRGFLKDQNDLQFVTDRRSEKCEQIRHQALGELCWYFPKTREQFRILGTLTLISMDTPEPPLQTVRHTLWQALSDNARLQFAWPHPGNDRAEAAAFQPESPSSSNPLPNFCALLIRATQVDHLELRGEPQNRWLYQLDQTGVWTQIAINP